MLLTLYYMYATLIQWWRIHSLRKKITKAITNQTALVLYQKDHELIDKHQANLKDLLFFTENKIGCTMMPKRHIFLNQWMPFTSTTLFPFLIRNNIKLASPNFPILIRADYLSFASNLDTIQLSDLGVPIAWTANEDFSLILKTDLDNFAKLIACFLNSNIAINDGMQVLRIETVDLDGEPTELDSVFKKIKWPFPVNSHQKWNKFVEDLKLISQKICTPNKNGNLCKLNESEPKIIINEVTTTQIPSNTIEKANKNELKSERKHRKHEKSNSVKDLKETAKESDQHTTKELPKEPKDQPKEPKKPTKEPVKTKEPKEKRLTKEQPEKKSETKTSTSKEKHFSSKDKRSASKEKLKTSTSSDKLKHKDSPDKPNKDRLVKKRSKENVLNHPPEPSPITIEKTMAELKPKKKPFIKSKPPNVLVYADSLETRENVKTVLNEVLNKNRYTIYELSATSSPHFTDNCTLVVVCGNVNPKLTSHLLYYLLNGGNLLCLCSDFLNSVLHTFTTAEVREHELVRFTYGEWKRVRMMHHIFCYQASPAKKHFSQDSDPNSSNHSSGNSPVAPRTPSTVEVQHNNKAYTVQVRVLGQEETWQTPSILLANVKGGAGKAVFSQVHLEIDPTQYQSDENKYAALKESNAARLQILKDILSSHLEMDCTIAPKTCDDYKPAYFLGKHDSKLKMLSEISGLVDNTLKLSKLTLNFCGKNVDPPQASSSLLPVLIHACPENFSTIEYFENLNTNLLGRLVIYSDVMTSSMDVLDHTKYEHGLVVLPARQTQGTGRGGNAWLSPVGCAMFSMQIHIPMNSILSKGLPLVQHLVSVAIVSAIRSQPGYEDIDLGLKWPNDIYADSSVKIGGIILNSSVESTHAICNIGSGTNLSNSLPTTCINSLITKHNEAKGGALKTLSFEKYLALVFNEMERIYDIIQSGDLDYFYGLYYKYWLHSGAEIIVQTSDGVSREVIVTGIDQYGYLTVTSRDGITSSVEPDGNTFDMMQGLIAPKIR